MRPILTSEAGIGGADPSQCFWPRLKRIAVDRYLQPGTRLTAGKPLGGIWTSASRDDRDHLFFRFLFARNLL